MTVAPVPCFDHLVAMTDRHGTFEHADRAGPRPERGYCTDDMARVLVVASREPRPSARVQSLAALSMRFLRDAQERGGDYRNRMDRRGRWQDEPTVGDCWGRSIWALGTAAANADAGWKRRVATAELERAAQRRSPWPRSMAYAALGAAELLSGLPDHREARALLTDAAAGMPAANGDAEWPWPEPRLTYANAVLPESMIAAGDRLRRPELLQRGLDLLRWLLDHETCDGHLSVTPVGGSDPGAPRPAFDQQPIEVAALAEACARAATVDGSDSRWPRGVEAAAAWFLGDNDGGHPMWDAQTGGGFDGLQIVGVNRNQGAESTLAALAALQHARRIVVSVT
jgi:hypothetical protein